MPADKRPEAKRRREWRDPRPANDKRLPPRPRERAKVFNPARK